MNDTAPETGAPAAATVRPPKVRLDRSRAFSTVHGDRGPNDPHSGTHYYQDGLPFDAHGLLILDHPDFEGSSKEVLERRRTAEKKLHKAASMEAKRRSRGYVDPEEEAERRRAAQLDDGDGEGEGTEPLPEDEDDDGPEPINLTSWLMGEQEVEWNDVSQEIARKYKKRMSSIADAVPFLVKENVCAAGAVHRKFKKFLD